MKSLQGSFLRMATTVAVTSFVLILAAGNTSGVSAQSGGFGGRPANPDPNNPRSNSIFIYTLKLGEVKTDQILLQNNSDKEKSIELTAVDGIVTNTGSYTCKQNAEATQDLGAWIKLSKNKVTLKPSEKMNVDFTVSMPKNADVGEHNACITFQDAFESPESKNGISIKTRQAVRVVATVPGQLNRTIDISRFFAETSEHKQYLGINLKNNGNVSADTDIKVRLKDLWGRVLYENGGAYPVISDQKLELRFENDKAPFWGGWYRAEADIAYDKRAGSFGTEDKGQLIKKSANPFVVFIMPATGALAVYVLGLILVLAVLAWLWLRTHQVKTVKTKWASYTVRDGDTLARIATKCGISWKHLARANKLKAPYSLKSGMKIKIPIPKDYQK